MMQNSSLMETSCNKRLDENDDRGKHGDIQSSSAIRKNKNSKKTMWQRREQDRKGLTDNQNDIFSHQTNSRRLYTSFSVVNWHLFSTINNNELSQQLREDIFYLFNGP